jgi:hypothetical protein
MFVQSVTAFMIASLAMGQTPVPAAQITTTAPAQSMPASQPAPAVSASTIVLPTGTAIQLTLMSAVKSKSTKAGDTVRAVVAFPVTIGTQLAIPAGTFVDGDVLQVTAHPKAGQQPSFRVHFTRLVFSNGYSVALNGENTQALVLPIQGSAPGDEVAELTPLRMPNVHFAMGEGQEPPLTEPPPLPRVGPNPAVVIGISLGATAALLTATLLLAHHHANNTDFLLYDAGWQFQMVLDSPVTLDATQVTAATAAPGGN